MSELEHKETMQALTLPTMGAAGHHCVSQYVAAL